MPFSRGSFGPKDQTLISCISCIAEGFLTTELMGKPPQSGLAASNPLRACTEERGRTNLFSLLQLGHQSSLALGHWCSWSSDLWLRLRHIPLPLLVSGLGAWTRTTWTSRLKSRNYAIPQHPYWVSQPLIINLYLSLSIYIYHCLLILSSWRTLNNTETVKCYY